MAACQIKNNNLDQTTELWIRGEFIAGWAQLNLNDQQRRVLEAMMWEVWEQAKKDTEKPLRIAIERALQGR